MKPLRSKRMDRTLVSGIQPSVCLDAWRACSASDWLLCFPCARRCISRGSRQRQWWDYAGSGLVALCFGIECLAWMFSVVPATVIERVPASSSKLAAPVLVRSRFRFLDSARWCWCSCWFFERCSALAFCLLPIRPVLKHGPRSLTWARVTGLQNLRA